MRRIKKKKKGSIHIHEPQLFGSSKQTQNFRFFFFFFEFFSLYLDYFFPSTQSNSMFNDLGRMGAGKGGQHLADSDFDRVWFQMRGPNRRIYRSKRKWLFTGGMTLKTM